MPSGNIVVQVDRPEGPGLKTDTTLTGPARHAELIAEGPGLGFQTVYIRIETEWNIGKIRADYYKSDVNSTTVEIQDSAAAQLGTNTGTVAEDFVETSVIDFSLLDAPMYLILTVTSGADDFLYYQITFEPSISGRVAPGASDV